MRCLLCPLESALLKEAVAQHSAQVLGGGLHAEEPALPSAESRRRIHPDSHPGAARPSNDDGPRSLISYCRISALGGSPKIVSYSQNSQIQISSGLGGLWMLA